MDVIQISIVVATFIIAIIGILTFLSKYYKKIICATMTSSISLPDIKDEKLRSSIKITFNGREISNFSITKIKVINAGLAPISKKHVEQPITFEFNEDVEVVKWDFIGKEYKAISPEISYKDNKKNSVMLDFGLLNKNASISFELICIGGSGKKPDIYANIENVHKIKKKRGYSKEDAKDELSETKFLLAMETILFVLIIAISGYGVVSGDLLTFPLWLLPVPIILALFTLFRRRQIHRLTFVER